jgi:predicted phosphodiesterase
MPGDDVPNWDAVLKIWGLDPEKFRVVEPVVFNVWGDPLGNLNRQWKGKVVQKVTEDFDPSALQEEIKNHKRSNVKITYGEGVFNVVLADWQMGKGEGGGSRATVARVLLAIALVTARVKELRRLGRQLGVLQILWTGDSVEGCLGFYEMQEWQTDLDRREQVNVVRRLLLKAIQAWSPYFGEVRVVAVAGNHGENRRGSKAYTTFSDNDDLAVIDQVRDALAVNPEVYGHVKFVMPPDHLTVTVETAGWILGLTHGHVARESGNAESKLRRWFERMAGTRQAVGDSDILVTGHYHHFRSADWGACHWLQAPAMDGGSEWYRLSTGENARPGVLTFATYPEKRVADMEVLS